MPVPKAPTIADVFSMLSPKERDAVTAKFLGWLAEAGRSVESNEDLMVLANLVSYHADDLKAVMKNALKDEFKDLVDMITKLMGFLQ